MPRKLTRGRAFYPTYDKAGQVRSTRVFRATAPTAGTFTFDREPKGTLDLADNPMGEPVVRFAGRKFPQRYVVHSPTGFEWGYGGSGPSDLALNILCLFVPPPEAWTWHHDFKAHFIATLPSSGGRLEAQQVRQWLTDQWAINDLTGDAEDRRDG